MQNILFNNNQQVILGTTNHDAQMHYDIISLPQGRDYTEGSENEGSNCLTLLKMRTIKASVDHCVLWNMNRWRETYEIGVLNNLTIVFFTLNN